MTPAQLGQLVNSYLPEPHAALLNGILLGLPLKSMPVFYTKLQTVGLLHIVVLSGMNITILCALITQLTGMFSKKVSILITIICVLGFVYFVSPQAPIVRAVLSSLLTSVAILFGKKTVPLIILLISALISLIFNPAWLTSISFQLTYAATLGLILFAKKQPYVEHANLLAKAKNNILDEFRTSCAAQVFTAPIIFFVFSQFSVISPLANIAVAWTIGPIMVFGLLLVGLGSIHHALGVIPAWICYVILSYVVWVVEMLSRIPFALMQF